MGNIINNWKRKFGSREPCDPADLCPAPSTAFPAPAASGVSVFPSFPTASPKEGQILLVHGFKGHKRPSHLTLRDAERQMSPNYPFAVPPCQDQ